MDAQRILSSNYREWVERTACAIYRRRLRASGGISFLHMGDIDLDYDT